MVSTRYSSVTVPLVKKTLSVLDNTISVLYSTLSVQQKLRGFTVLVVCAPVSDFFRLMNEVENEDLVLTLEVLVENFGEEMAPYALGLVTNLVCHCHCTAVSLRLPLPLCSIVLCNAIVSDNGIITA